MDGVGGGLPGAEGEEGGESFDLKDFRVGEDLAVDAKVGIGEGFNRREVGGEAPVFVEVIDGGQAVEEADFQGAAGGVLTDAPGIAGEGEAGIIERNVRPEDEVAVGEEVSRVGAEGGLGDEGGAAGVHDAEGPEGAGLGEVAQGGEAVDDGGAGGAGVEVDFEAALPARAGFGRGAEAGGEGAEGVVEDGEVVGVVAVIGLGGDPEAVTAPGEPIAALGVGAVGPSFAGLVGKFLKEVGTIRGATEEDAGADFEGGDEAKRTVVEFEAAVPAAEGNFADHAGEHDEVRAWGKQIWAKGGGQGRCCARSP